MTTIGRWTTLLAAACLAGTVNAGTVVLDGSTGADYDSVGDGWFFAGMDPSTPPDGTGDAGEQPLGVALIENVLELRAMAEFPLEPLAEVDPDDITSATLTVTIDDVLTTFGPGATFDGTAADEIQAFAYVGDGIVTTADFAPPASSPIGAILPGVVTDATLQETGALSFDLDVTDVLKAMLAGGAPAFGVLLATDDSPTGTSLDDVSPPGVAGGRLPFLTIEVAGLETTTTTTSTTTTTEPTETTTTTSTSTTEPTVTTTTTSTTTTTEIEATTTTSTAAPPTTTSTTLPPSCGSGATLASIGCRVGDLGDAIAGSPDLGAAAPKLQKQLGKIEGLLEKARAAIDAGNRKQARSLLRKISTRYRALGKPLRSLKGRKTIPAELRNQLLAVITALANDTKALAKSL
ncbi:MAG: hypothetical protein KIT14_05815 [bacterium]|nr:hypothetical protein [bacterium]